MLLAGTAPDTQADASTASEHDAQDVDAESGTVGLACSSFSRVLFPLASRDPTFPADPGESSPDATVPAPVLAGVHISRGRACDPPAVQSR
jgi:hypothetical protein